MKKMTLFSAMLLLLNSCVGQKKEEAKKIITPENLEPQTSSINCLNSDPAIRGKIKNIDPELLTSDHAYKKLIKDNFFYRENSISINDIEEVVKIGVFEIINFGNATIWSVKLSDDLPSTVFRNVTLVVNQSKNKAALLPIEDFALVKVNPKLHQGYIGGYRMARSTGYYMIYDANANEFFPIMDTWCFCEHGLPVINQSLDCQSYSPFLLPMENTDIDKDGWLDLKFTGEFLFFCEGLERGYGRKDREPLRRLPVELIFYGMQKQSAISWELRDNSLCKFYE